jgi:hypothetical protein
MNVLDSIRDSIKYSESKELAKYMATFASVFCLIFGFLIYLSYRQVNKYNSQLKQLDSWRKQTQQILRDAKIVRAQQEEVEEILSKDKDFRIGEAYQSVVRKANLSGKLVDTSLPTTGETISSKTEVLVTSRLKGLSMKEVTDFLVGIAQVPQMYTKEVTIKRTPGRPMVDIDIAVATLELSE